MDFYTEKIQVVKFCLLFFFDELKIGLGGKFFKVQQLLDIWRSPKTKDEAQV